jgi:formyl-CoA transferase
MVFSLPHSSGASAPQIANPIKFSRSSIDYLRAPPALGEHTEAILANELGKSVEQIHTLRRNGTI